MKIKKSVRGLSRDPGTVVAGRSSAGIKLALTAAIAACGLAGTAAAAPASIHEVSAGSKTVVDAVAPVAEDPAASAAGAGFTDAMSPGSYILGKQLRVRLFADVLGVPRAGARVSVERSRFTAGGLAGLKARIRSNARGHSFGMYYDPSSDRLVVEGDLPPDVLPSRDVRAGAVELSTEAVAFETETSGAAAEPKPTQPLLSTRDNDASPHFAGARIHIYGKAASGDCTVGFPVRRGGETYHVTAGHCGEVNDALDSGRHDYGRLKEIADRSKYDVALINDYVVGNNENRLDWEVMWTDEQVRDRTGKLKWRGDWSEIAKPTRNAAGGWQSAYADPLVGTEYCTSGVTTGLQCRKKVVDLKAEACFTNPADPTKPAQCLKNLVKVTGGTPSRPGDSGSALILMLKGGKVYPRGITLGSGYFHKWSTIRDALRVTEPCAGDDPEPLAGCPVRSP